MTPEPLPSPATAARKERSRQVDQLDRKGQEILRDYASGRIPLDAPAVLENLYHLAESRLSLLNEEGEEEAPDPLELVAELAHDFRSPLTSILFLADTLREGHSGPVSEQQQSQLRLIYSAALRILSVANDVMEMSEAGRPLVGEEPVPFSIREVMESVWEMALPTAQEKAVELRLSPPERDRCIGRPMSLGRIFLNLATNSLQFTETGYVEIAAQVVEGSLYEFSVRDTGRGISPEAEPRLFQPFRKARWREGWLFSSTGLGLSIVRRLVAAMGSELLYETSPDRGTRFHFRLDLPPAPDIH